MLMTSLAFFFDPLSVYLANLRGPMESYRELEILSARALLWVTMKIFGGNISLSDKFYKKSLIIDSELEVFYTGMIMPVNEEINFV